MLNLLGVPTDLINVILSNTNASSILQFGTTCKKAQELSKAQDLWKTVCSKSLFELPNPAPADWKEWYRTIHCVKIEWKSPDKTPGLITTAAITNDTLILKYQLGKVGQQDLNSNHLLVMPVAGTDYSPSIALTSSHILLAPRGGGLLTLPIPLSIGSASSPSFGTDAGVPLCLAADPTEERVWAGYPKGKVICWNTSTQSKEDEFSVESGGHCIEHLLRMQDRLILTTKTRGIFIRHLIQNSSTHVTGPSTEEIRSIARFGQNHFITTSSRDWKLRLWDLDGNCRMDHPLTPEHATDNSFPIAAAAYPYVITGFSGLKTLTVWLVARQGLKHISYFHPPTTGSLFALNGSDNRMIAVGTNMFVVAEFSSGKNS